MTNKNRKSRPEEPEQLRGQDPRLYAVDVHGTSVAMLASSVRHAGTTLHFGFPGPAALYLSMARKSFLVSRRFKIEKLAKRTDQGLEVEEHSEFFDLLELRVQNVIFSLSAIEVFANELIPDSFVFEVPRKDDRCTERYSKPQIERNTNLRTKLAEVVPKITGRPSFKGQKLWEDYRSLEELRDRLIHAKSADVRASGPDDESVWRALIDSLDEDFSLIARNVLLHISEGTARGQPRWLRLFPYD